MRRLASVAVIPLVVFSLLLISEAGMAEDDCTIVIPPAVVEGDCQDCEEAEIIVYNNTEYIQYIWVHVVVEDLSGPTECANLGVCKTIPGHEYRTIILDELDLCGDPPKCPDTGDLEIDADGFICEEADCGGCDLMAECDDSCTDE